MDIFVGFIRSILSAHLPEGKLKEFLRSHFFRHRNPLYALNKIISEAELLQDGTLFVKLNNGINFYGQRDKVSHPLMKYADLEKLDKIKDFKYFGAFLGTLCEQYVKSIYEKYYELEKGDIVVDVGAHIGAFSVKAAKIVGKKGKVVAIEPEVNNLSFLRRNIEANELRNVTIVPIGIWSGRGELKLNLSTYRTGQHSFYRDRCYGTKDAGEFEEVEVDTLDNMLRELGVKKVDFIKIDVEGAEIEVLKGMDEALRNSVNLAIAAYHFVDGKETYKTIVPSLRERGFEVHREGGIVYVRAGV